MTDFPIDINHPVIRDYLALVRLQVLTPLSLLINLATIIICTVVANPSIGGVSKQFPTSISPKPAVIAIYVIAIFAGQLGYCILLVIVRKDETKKTITSGVGLSLVLSNWFMAFWAISWIFQWFLLATIFQGVLLLLLVYANVVLLIYHSPTSQRPFDTMLIHAPMRFFLVLQLALMFPLTLFVGLGLTYPSSTGEPPYDYTSNPWPGFGVVLGTNILGLVVIVMRHDVVWSVAATWVCVSIWALRPKPSPVYITAIIFTVLHPLTLVGSLIYSYFFKGQQRRIALPADDEHPGLYGINTANNVPADGNTNGNGPREVDEEAVWG